MHICPLPLEPPSHLLPHPIPLGCHRVLVWALTWSEVAQSRLTLWDPMDCSLPGSSIHGIFQARVLEWVAISSHTANSHWWSTLHTVMYMFPCYFLPLLPCPLTTSLFSTSASPLLPCKEVHQYHLSRFHIYALIYDVCFLFLTDFTLYNRL